MGGTLMIVEDNAFFRGMLKTLIQTWLPSLAIVEAGDVPEALQAAAEHLPDVILMDIHLPSGSGLHLTRRIKGELPRTTVIVCTTETCQAIREAAFASGASHFISKGELSPKSIRDVIEAALARLPS